MQLLLTNRLSADSNLNVLFLASLMQQRRSFLKGSLVPLQSVSREKSTNSARKNLIFKTEYFVSSLYVGVTLKALYGSLKTHICKERSHKIC